jgi:hypothetical protein
MIDQARLKRFLSAETHLRSGSGDGVNGKFDAIVATTRGPGGDRVEQFDQLTFDEAQTALNTFYENSGGRRSAGGR